jgi:prepilin-type N-terminal cleavage/methylation domain-containing protein
MKTRGGFTLIELVLAISIIALLIMAIGSASGVRQSAKVQSAAESIRTLRIASESYIAGGSTTFTGITIASLKTAGLLPSGFSATGSNPWGGGYSVTANSGDSSKVDIALTSVPDAAATRLTALFANSASSTSLASGTWTATF